MSPYRMLSHVGEREERTRGTVPALVYTRKVFALYFALAGRAHGDDKSGGRLQFGYLRDRECVVGAACLCVLKVKLADGCVSVMDEYSGWG